MDSALALINCFFSGESTKVKAEKVEAVVPQGNYQQKMLIQFRKIPKVLISHLSIILNRPKVHMLHL